MVGLSDYMILHVFLLLFRDFANILRKDFQDIFYGAI